MCFSATSSFLLSGVLATIGSITLYKNRKPSLILFASIPLFFAFQQSCEGLVWLTLNNPQYALVHQMAIYAFLLFALPFWPVFMPLSLWVYEKDAHNKNYMLFFIAAGLFTAAFSSYHLLQSIPSATIAQHSIKYTYTTTTNVILGALHSLCYLIGVSGAFFSSSIYLARIIGVAGILSLAITLLFKWAAFVSVWCFFAAVLSVLVYVSVTREQR